MHDRNRETALYDPAQPGRETYVRVTRRRGPPEVEAALAAHKAERVAEERQRMAQHHEEANELLQLRSMLVQNALVANREATKMVKAGDWKRGGGAEGGASQPQEAAAVESRAAELHKKLGIDKVQLVTSPLIIDTTPQAGHNTASAAPAPAAANWQAAAKQVSNRGGAWPVDMSYFTGPKPSKAGDRMTTEVSHQLKTVVHASG
jgi:hypothetical protein